MKSWWNNRENKGCWRSCDYGIKLPGCLILVYGLHDFSVYPLFKRMNFVMWMDSYHKRYWRAVRVELIMVMLDLNWVYGRYCKISCLCWLLLHVSNVTAWLNHSLFCWIYTQKWTDTKLLFYIVFFWVIYYSNFSKRIF